MSLVFVGQGPNRTAWLHGLQVGRQYSAIKLGVPPEDPRVELPAVGWAERYCERVAITGSVGKKIAELAGFPLDLKFGGHDRRNLNTRWNGKRGKGDSFDRAEGKKRASELLAGPWTHYVLLGDEVARCFAMKPEALNVVTDFIPTLAGPPVKKAFLLFPHPSGINLWWNEEFNRFRARKRLREFVSEEPKKR